MEQILPRWAPTERQTVITTPAQSPLTQGGDWNAGKTLFSGEAKCATCHTLRGEGGAKENCAEAANQQAPLVLHHVTRSTPLPPSFRPACSYRSVGAGI